MMDEGSKKTYRALQKHLNKMPIGFPKSWNGCDIRLLQYLFTEDEARLALHLDYLPRGLETIRESIGDTSIPLEVLERAFHEMCKKGGITGKHGEDGWEYFLHPWVIGISDLATHSAWQFGRTTEPIQDMGGDFGIKFVLNTATIEQLMFRTIPISQSITPEHHIATYDEVRELIESSHGKFVSLPCMCKKNHKNEGKPCTRTNRIHTCMALRDNADICIKTGIGQKITKEEALEIVRMNEEEGLVLQTENAKKPNWLCGCCGDCCTILNSLKMFPRPFDFARGNFQASINEDSCVGCGTCANRCHMGAISIGSKRKVASINIKRCIGCGVCVPTCKAGAIRLKRRAKEEEPEENRDSYMKLIDANKKNWYQKVGKLLKTLLKR
ncbi:MAG: ATP-binding protein [Candidatus Hodarchaeota archaeon]